MTLYVDTLQQYAQVAGNTRWCHLMSDVSDEELHTFALRLGCKREWFQGDHYDLVPSKRTLAVLKGAVECETSKLVEIRKARREVKT